MAKAHPQSKFDITRANDILGKLVDDFEKNWKENRRPISAGEITAVTTAITTILQS
jgi:hypothetical protein